jgi:hypothetical protein
MPCEVWYAHMFGVLGKTHGHKHCLILGAVRPACFLGLHHNPMRCLEVRLLWHCCSGAGSDRAADAWSVYRL